MENASNAFNLRNVSNDDATHDKEKGKLLAKIGQLTVEVVAVGNDWTNYYSNRTRAKLHI